MIKTTNIIIGFFLIIGVLLTSCGPDLPEDVAEAYDDLPQTLDFNIHVKPILSDKCYACHGPDKAKQKAGLRLDQAETSYAELPESPGKRAIDPGNLKNSEFYHRILSQDPNYKMPTTESNLKLTSYEKATLVKWIEDGAEYKPHWAFIKPEKPKVPRVKFKDYVSNEIDNFVIKKLETRKLKPSPQADKELLLRRLSFDLTGLPPSPEEIKKFKEDKSENAYEKQVDRLLSSPHFGEKMAIDWMDLARYSDTHGYQVDRYRDMSPWRDWVINSFNNNMSYDQFITWQLAGDLLPNPSKEQILATAFNRLHPQNMEGGIVDEEFRSEYVADRASVVGQGFMALTVACARCHDHKYDPISQKNFYELYSFFNNINESGQIDYANATPVPTQLLPTKKQEEVLNYLEDLVAEKEKQQQYVELEEDKAATQWLKTEAYKQIRSVRPVKDQVAHYQLENKLLRNRLNPRQKGMVARKASTNEVPTFAKGYRGKGLLLDGDAWLDLDKVGIFKRNHAFSIGIWANIPNELSEGVIFHKNNGSRLHSFKGYHLYLKDDKLELMMAHTWPDNAIIKTSEIEAIKDEWVQFTVTYDGSSKAAGYKLYMNGEEVAMKTEHDNLYKDIIFRGKTEPGLQVGARWRGKGLRGAKVDEIVVYKRVLTPLEVMQIVEPKIASSLVATSYDQLDSSQKDILKQHYLAHFSKKYQSSSLELAQTRTSYVDSIELVKEIMVMKEMSEPRKTFVLERGQYDAYGEQVFPNTPQSVLSLPKDLPRNRLGLAKWLTLPEHPLTARVAVNRYWQNYFGRGIVRTTEDFGNQGELPSHPKLLDWLAISFVESGWDVKALQKTIVMSSTYRQSSFASPEMQEMDKENVLLARGPNVRLSSEMMRDNALTASGLLNPKIGGESVRPYQPEGLWKMNGGKYVQDTGDKVYRRSLYTIWKRTVPNPTLSTFDQPERSECTVRRQKTNTPLQALVLLNDPTYLETAKVMGEQMTKMPIPEEGIKMAFTQLTGKTPKPEEMEILLKLRATEYENFKANTEKTKGWLAAGQYAIDNSLDTNLVAANAIVASVILNADVTITKR